MMIELLLACYVVASFHVPADWTVLSVENRPNSVLLHLKKPVKAGEEVRVPAGCLGEGPKPTSGSLILPYVPCGIQQNWSRAP